MKEIFLTVYFSLLFFICVYGIHLYWLIFIYLKHRSDKPKPSNGKLGRTEYPIVTVQLPLYNEKRVALRLIDAVRNFDWPKDKLEIQILDDSTDITSQIIQDYLDSLKDEHSNILYNHRNNRDGFKAGALAEGLETARGEYIAIFDADNIPEPDFLQRTVPFFNDTKIGMVQTRWGYLNRSESLLCRAQALFLDAHFAIEQQARFYGGLLFNFNGTAGIWRKTTITDAGGWQHDTLTEDLDLSFRAQLAGWKFIYDHHHVVPTELPNSINAFKSQQYRWSKGAVETGIKLLGTIFRSSLPLRAKIGALFHMYSKLLNLAVFFLAIMLIPALYFRLESGTMKLFLIDLPIFLAGTGSMSLYYSLAYKSSKRHSSLRDKLTLPLLTSLAVALSVNNTRALLSALFKRNSAFIRTPKAGTTDTQQRHIPRSYRQRVDRSLLIESALTIYSVMAIASAIHLGLYPTIPFLGTFFIGYFYFSYRGLREEYAR